MYSSVGRSDQTIGSSGCGPTSAATVVTACRGAIDPRKNGRPFRKVSDTGLLIMVHTGQHLEL